MGWAVSRIAGVTLLPGLEIKDHRGSLVAVRLDCDLGGAPQFNIVRSQAGVLRGMHVHTEYDEYYYPGARTFFALKDVRPGSPSLNESLSFWSEDLDGAGFCVPKGVLHGVFFAAPEVLVYGLSAPWTGKGEFGCRWDDPELGVSWPCDQPILSARDSHAEDYAVVRKKFGMAVS